MSTNEALLRRRVRVWRAVAIGTVVGATLLAGLGMRSGAGREVIGVAGGDDFIYRIWSDGGVDRLNVSGDVRTSRGIASRARVKIDPSLRQSGLFLDNP